MGRLHWESAVVLALGMVLGAVMVLMMTGAWAKPSQPEATLAPDVVRAQRFELVDSAGQPRAELGLSPEGLGIGLFDQNGKLRAALQLSPEGKAGWWRTRSLGLPWRIP